MKKSLLFLLLFTGAVNAQIVNIPDANLKAALLSNTLSFETVSGIFYDSVDINGDGEIELSEAQDIRQVLLDGLSISDMTGIEAFTNLEGLSITNNQITTLNLTMLPLLQFVGCTDNPLLTSIDVSGLTQMTNIQTTNIPQMQQLNISGSAITSILITQDSFQYLDASNCTGLTTISVTSAGLFFIDFDGCSALDNMSIQSTQLTSIDVQNLPSLTWLHINLNAQLSNLTFTNCPLLNNLYCAGNIISSIDVSGLPALQQLWLDSTLVSTLDVSANHQLTFLVCSNNQLQYVDIKNGSAETFFSFGGNPNLAFVCADDNEVAFVQSELIGDDITGAAVSSYCSFTPGGNYNTISGTVHYDNNGNGCDAADLTPANIRFDINSSAGAGASFTGTTGGYAFYTQAGSFNLAPTVENPAFYTFTPATAAVNFPNNNNNTAVRDFCIAPNGAHQDIEVVIAPVNSARPGFNAVYSIVYKNKGAQTISQASGITLAFNDDQMDFVSATQAPASSGTGSLAWSYANLLPFESREIEVTMHIHAPTDTTPVNNGDILQFTNAIAPTAADENAADNTFAFSQTVIGSLDPNDIICLEGPVVPPSQIGNYLHYMVNFENTGTDVAENIVVRLQIDPAKYNIGSLQLLGASNPVTARINGNVAEFIFQTIGLGIGGHGHILLKIRSNSALTTGAVVFNRADIYFDYNLPVDTGQANTTFQTLATTGFAYDSSIALSPNPTTGELTITAQTAIEKVFVYDVQGRLLLTALANDRRAKIDLSAYPKGMYFVKVFTAEGMRAEKVMRK